MPIHVGTTSSLEGRLLEEMHQLRRRVFRDRLRWAVPFDDRGERDEFDHEHAVYIVTTGSEDGQVQGCVRLLPTQRPYMLDTVFVTLLGGRAAPCRPEVWEMSRFAFDRGRERRPGWGFSTTVLQLVAGTMDFAATRGIDRYLLATTLSIERMMRAQGMNFRRLGPVLQIGGVESVALALEADTITRAAARCDARQIVTDWLRPPALAW